MRRIICRHGKKLRALAPLHHSYVYQAEVYLVHQCGGLESIGVAFIFHKTPGHQAQLGVDLLR
jgi:hypothetical protein